MTVTLRGFSHTWPADVDMLLVGPDGQKVMLLSDVGGGGFSINNVNVTLSDAAGGSLSAIGMILPGTYKPTNIEPGESGELDAFPAPAPAAPYGSALSAFSGGNPNGVWSLYAVDDGPGDAGQLISGWSITMTTVASGPQAPTISDIGNQTIAVNTRGRADFLYGC